MQPRVEVLDANGLRVLSAALGATATVTLALSAATTAGSSAVLGGGARAVAAVDGLATFERLSIELTGTFALVASAPQLASASSAAFVVAADPAGAASLEIAGYAHAATVKVLLGSSRRALLALPC